MDLYSKQGSRDNKKLTNNELWERHSLYEANRKHDNDKESNEPYDTSQELG